MKAEYPAGAQLRWLWIMLGVAAVLVIMLIVSSVTAGHRDRLTLVGPSVKTGNPMDYLEPAKTPPTVPQPSPPLTTPQPEEQPAQPPLEIPRSFDYEGQKWLLTGELIRAEVVAIGKLPDGRTIYAEVEDTPPYEALYIESTTNSGKYYKYVPATPTESE